MFFFGSKKPTSQNHLVISIESSHIRACFVSVQEYQKPYIIEQYIQTVQGDQYSIENINKTLDQTISSLIQKKPTKIDKVVCIFSSPWYISHMDTYIRDEENPFVFRERDAKKILQDTTHDFYTTYKDKGDFELLEKKILHVGINGYEIHNFYKEHTRRVEVSTYVSLIGKEIKQSIEKTIHRHVSKEISFHTSMLVQSVVSRDVFQYLENFVLVSIEGLYSEVSIVHQGSPVHGEVIMSGEHLIFKKSESESVYPDIILSELKTLSSGGLHQQASIGLRKTVKNAEEEWRRHFVHSLETVTKNIPLPEHCVVISKETTFFWIKNALEDPRNKHLSVSDKNLHAILMNAEALQPFLGTKIPEPDFKLMIYAAFTSI